MIIEECTLKQWVQEIRDKFYGGREFTHAVTDVLELHAPKSMAINDRLRLRETLVDMFNREKIEQFASRPTHGVVYAGRISRTPRPERTAGIDRSLPRGDQP